jgi:dephospho-CoA kinase
MKLKAQFKKLAPADRLYQLDRPVIGLTGGIATGKSTVTKFLRALGLEVVDADQLVKSVYQTQGAKAFIRSHFPQAWQNGETDFKVLREIFFTDEKAKQKIEAFIYGSLPEEFKKATLASTQEFVIYDVPLLFEKNLASKCDLSVLVYAPENVQLARLLDRDKHEERLGRSILAQQEDIEVKKLKADFVIDNSGTMEELKMNVSELLREIFI